MSNFFETVERVFHDWNYRHPAILYALMRSSFYDGQKYIVLDYEKDITHIHRLSLASWAKMFMRPGWKVEAAYRMHGVKDNYSQWEWGNGFLICRRSATSVSF